MRRIIIFDHNRNCQPDDRRPRQEVNPLESARWARSRALKPVYRARVPMGIKRAVRMAEKSPIASAQRDDASLKDRRERYLMTLNSMRRFFERPAFVLLDAIGFAEPWPFTSSRPASMP